MSTVFGDPVGLLQDPEDVLRIEQQRYVQRVQEERETRLHIREVCQTAWNKFFAEDSLQCSQLVQALAVVDTVPPPSVTDLISSVDGLVEGTEMHGPGALTFTTWYADTNQLRTRSIPSVLSVLPSAASRAYPKYESCTPSLQNIKYIGDQRVLTFIPYADEDGFQKLIPKFARCHRWFAWQTGWVDVDGKREHTSRRCVCPLTTTLVQSNWLSSTPIYTYKPPMLRPCRLSAIGLDCCRLLRLSRT